MTILRKKSIKYVVAHLKIFKFELMNKPLQSSRIPFWIIHSSLTNKVGFQWLVIDSNSDIEPGFLLRANGRSDQNKSKMYVSNKLIKIFDP